MLHEYMENKIGLIALACVSSLFTNTQLLVLSDNSYYYGTLIYKVRIWASGFRRN